MRLLFLQRRRRSRALALTAITITALRLRHRGRPAPGSACNKNRNIAPVDDELGDNDRKRGNALEAGHQGNDTGLDHQPRAAPSRLKPCIQGFEVGVNCAAAVVILAPAGRTSAQGHHVAAAARAFWPRRSSSNRRWLAHETVQQPVLPCRQNQQTCLKCLILLVVCNFSLSDSNGQTGLKFPGKVYRTLYWTLAKAQEQLVPCFRGGSGA